MAMTARVSDRVRCSARARRAGEVGGDPSEVAHLDARSGDLAGVELVGPADEEVAVPGELRDRVGVEAVVRSPDGEHQVRAEGGLDEDLDRFADLDVDRVDLRRRKTVPVRSAPMSAVPEPRNGS
jgi:hypothetical protein